MQVAQCVNCGKQFYSGQKFCDQCGQKAEVHRITVPHLFHEFFHAFTHADKSMLSLIRHLAIRPGVVAAEYVEGKRKKYFNPFTFILICLGIMIFVNNIVKPYPEAKADPAVLAQIPTEQGRKMYLTSIERSNEANKLVNKNANIVYLVAMPFYALIVWIFYRRRGRNFAEIVTAFIFFTGLIGLFFTVAFSPLMAYYRGTQSVLYFMLISIILFIVYYTWGLKRFLKFRSPLAYFHVFFVVVLVILLWSLLVGFLTIFYIYRDKTWLILQVLWQQLIK